MYKFIVKLCVIVILSMTIGACGTLKQAGRDIGHTTKKVTKDIGHATRDVAKKTVKAVKDN